MAIRPSGMTDEEYKKKDEEYKKKYGAATSANAGAAVGQSVRTAANFGGDFAKTLARPIPDAIMGVGKAIDNGVVAANNFVSSAIAGRPVQSMQPIAGSQAVAAPPRPAVAAPLVPIQAPPQRQSPSQRMTDDQANAAEVNARTATQPSSPQTGMGVPAGAGGAAPGGIVKSKDRNGNTVYTGTGAYAATGPAIAGTIGSVQNQNFGNAAVPQAQASIAQPRVASTFGMSVNDPRINDQTAQIARPGQMTFNSAAQTSEYNNAKEDRAARQAASGNIDTQLFMLRGKNDPASLQAMADLTQTQAKLNAGAEGLSQEAQQGRANRGNTFDIAGMEQAGQTTRQRMAGDVASQGQFLDYDAKNRATDASLIDKPQYVTDAQGRYLRVGATGAAPVTDAAGSAIQMPPPAQAQQRDYGAEKRMDAYTNILNGMRDMNGQLPPDAAAQAAALVAQAPGAQQPQAQAPQAAKVTSKADLDKLPKGARYLAPDGQVYIKN